MVRSKLTQFARAPKKHKVLAGTCTGKPCKILGSNMKTSASTCTKKDYQNHQKHERDFVAH